MDSHAHKNAYSGPERREDHPRLSQEDWRRQERVSSITHGIAAILSVAALWLLVAAAIQHHNLTQVVSFTVFGVSLIVLYTASAYLHGLPLGKSRRVFEDLDLAGIFLLIAGTYTPFSLVTLQGPVGWRLFGIIWTLALLGVGVMLWKKALFEKVAAYIYLAMGWLIVTAIHPLALKLPTMGLALLIAGGLAYSLGVILFLWERWLYHHAIWHVFVMVGSLCHFLAVLLYVVPDVRTGVLP